MLLFPRASIAKKRTVYHRRRGAGDKRLGTRSPDGQHRRERRILPVAAEPQTPSQRGLPRDVFVPVPRIGPSGQQRSTPNAFYSYFSYTDTQGGHNVED